MQNIVFKQSKWQENFINSLDMLPVKNEEKDSKAESLEEVKYKVQELLFPWKEINSSALQETLENRFINKNKKIAKAVLGKIEELSNLKDVCIAYTGSDGRGEKLSFFSAPMELMLIIKKADQINEETLKKLKDTVSEHPDLFFPKIEIKQLEEKDTSLIGFDQNWNEAQKKYRPFPTRGLDASYLLGDASIFTNYKTKFYKEVQDPKSSNLLHSFMRSNIKPVMGLMQRSVDGQEISNIDLKQGITTYNGDRIKATKFALLRPVQYKLAQHICKLIQEQRLSEEDFLKMPYSTIDRVNWLAQKNLLTISDKKISKIQKAYTASLIWEGMAQKNFEVNHQSIMSIPPQELQEVAQAICKFCTASKVFC